MTRHHQRRPTYPLFHVSRKKQRRWPLVLRFIKGAIHGDIIVPVVLHALFTAVVVYIDTYTGKSVGLPGTIIPSLSIVVGLMLVFRNGTSYERFWSGRSNLNAITNSIRNLTRSFLTNSSDPKGTPATPEERADTERTVRVLIAFVFAVKSSLRAEWLTVARPPAASADLAASEATLGPDHTNLLPDDLKGFEEDGLGLPIQLGVMLEAYIRRCAERGWISAPQASQLTGQVNALTDAYGRMEMIKSTSVPVAHLIHQKQVLALYTCILPFAMVDELKWFTVPIVSIIAFVFYGIDGIATQLSDPYGYDRNDIKMDAISEDTRQEIMVMLEEWKSGGAMFR